MFGQTNIVIADAAFIDSPQGGVNGTEAVLYVDKTTGVLTVKYPDGTLGTLKVAGAGEAIELVANP